jgi:peptidoglycan/xylan/chitin deacetylase (PgdA/CDA1 family)
MKTLAWVGAALALALSTGCKDRDRGDVDRTDAGDRVEATGDRANDQVQKAADETGNAAEDAANDAGDAAKDAGGEVKEAAKDVGDEFGATSYERRDEFRHEVDQRLAAMDKEIADLRKGINDNSTEAYRNAISAARETRRTVGQDVDRLAGATAANWDELKTRVSVSLDSLDHQVKALGPDAKPMGGAGPN